jgi:hypothetical protein
MKFEREKAIKNGTKTKQRTIKKKQIKVDTKKIKMKCEVWMTMITLCVDFLISKLYMLPIG